jgi:hypothetical protein
MAAALRGHSEVELSSREAVPEQCRPQHLAFAPKEPQLKRKIEVAQPRVESASASCRIAGAQVRKGFGWPIEYYDLAARSRTIELKRSRAKLRRPARNSPYTLRKFNLRKPATNSIPNGPFTGHSRAKREPLRYAVC